MSGPFWARVGVRVRARARVRGWVGSTPVPLSDHEVLSARKREQPTAPKIRAANLLGELERYPLRLESDKWSMVKGLRQAANEPPPPPRGRYRGRRGWEEHGTHFTKRGWHHQLIHSGIRQYEKSPDRWTDTYIMHVAGRSR